MTHSQLSKIQQLDTTADRGPVFFNITTYCIITTSIWRWIRSYVVDKLNNSVILTWSPTTTMCWLLSYGQSCTFVAHALNTTRIFYGTSRNNIDKLQRVQNILARVVKERGKYDHVTPLLSQLHWLPIEARIRHKIAVLAFKAVSRGNSAEAKRPKSLELCITG